MMTMETEDLTQTARERVRASDDGSRHGFCFAELKLERLYLDHYTGNPSGKLYQKLGFKYAQYLIDACSLRIL